MPPDITLSDFSFSANTVGYIINGKMDTPAINELKGLILEKLKEHEKINLYLEDSGIESFTANSVLIATLFPLEHSKRFHKIALVTNRKWIHMLGTLDKLLVNVKIKNYESKDRMEAIHWIAQW